MHLGALPNELLYGGVFFLIALCSKRLASSAWLALLAAGYLLHGVYDVIHDGLFINGGVPLWWPEFCGTVDIVIGLYLLWLALSSRRHWTMAGA